VDACTTIDRRASLIERSQLERIMAIASGIAPGERSPRSPRQAAFVDPLDRSTRSTLNGSTTDADQLEAHVLSTTIDLDNDEQHTTAVNGKPVWRNMYEIFCSETVKPIAAHPLPPLVTYVPDKYDSMISIVRELCAPHLTEALYARLDEDMYYYPPLPFDVPEQSHGLPPGDESDAAAHSNRAMHLLLWHLCCDSARTLMGVTEKNAYPLSTRLHPPALHRRLVASDVVKHAERVLLRAHPTLAHDAQIVVSPEGGACTLF
jgi:hypothetical protein